MKLVIWQEKIVTQNIYFGGRKERWKNKRERL